MEQSLSILQAIFLGAVQGITEFLPISSSGHLVALPAVLGWQEHSLQFDIALHMGTVLALVLYFWKDWASMGLAILGLGPGTPEERRERSRLAWVLMVACVPAAVLGVTIADAAETTLRSPLLVAGMLAGVGVLLLIADRTSRGARTVNHAAATAASAARTTKAIIAPRTWRGERVGAGPASSARAGVSTASRKATSATSR